MSLLSTAVLLTVTAGFLGRETHGLDTSPFPRDVESTSALSITTEAARESHHNKTVHRNVFGDGVLVLIACVSGLRVLREGPTALDLVTATNDPTRAVDFHFKRKEIFFITDHQILRTKNWPDLEKFSKPIMIVQGVSQNVTGLVVDWVHDSLYWTSNEAVEMAALDGSNRTVLFNSTPGHDLRDIAIDPYYMKLFWLNGSSVESSGLQGEDPRKVIDQMYQIDNLAIDLQEQKVYVIRSPLEPSRRYSLVRSDYDGTKFQEVLTSDQLEVTNGLGVFGRQLFWVNHESGKSSLYTVTKPFNNRKVNAIKIVEVPEGILNIRLFHQNVQSVPNHYSCWLKNCSHPKLCVTNSKLSECRCPPGWRLAEDLKSCTNLTRMDMSTTTNPVSNIPTEKTMDTFTAMPTQAPEIKKAPSVGSKPPSQGGSETAFKGDSETPSQGVSETPSKDGSKTPSQGSSTVLMVVLLVATLLVVIYLCVWASRTGSVYNIVAKFKRQNSPSNREIHDLS